MPREPRKQASWDTYEKHARRLTENNNRYADKRVQTWVENGYMLRPPLVWVDYTTKGWTVRLVGVQWEYATEDEAKAKAVELLVKGYARGFAKGSR